MRCPHCNSKLKRNTKFCPECGMTVIWEEESRAEDRKNGRGVIGIIVLAMLVIAGAVAFLVLGGYETTEDEIIPETTALHMAFSDDPAAISVAAQSVVKLNCYDESGELCATGSGFACFGKNVIVTNYHVIEGNVYRIEASTETGSSFNVPYILATEEEKDIAILGTAAPHRLALLQVGTSNALQKGEKVVAIGSPLGLLNSVSTGVFSGYVEESEMEIIQFTASVSSGSSGGALFNNEGEVLGITFASYDAGQNLNLAIPIEYAEQLYLNCENTDKRMVADAPSYDANDVVICNKDTKVYHPVGLCGDAMVGYMRLNGEKENQDYICISISEAVDLGYTQCENCGVR